MAVLFSACHKKSNDQPTPVPAKFTGCRISEITQVALDSSSKITYQFSYNDDGTVSKIVSQTYPGTDEMTKTFTYKTGCIIATTTERSSVSEKESIVLGAQDKVVYIDFHNYNGSPPPNEVWDSFSYDNSGYLMSGSYHNYGSFSSQYFEWKNGDLVWKTFGTDVYTYVYDSGLYNTGNITARINDLESYGRGIYTTKHLPVTAILNSADTLKITYTLDSGGRITYMNDPTNLLPNTLITYMCE